MLSLKSAARSFLLVSLFVAAALGQQLTFAPYTYPKQFVGEQLNPAEDFSLLVSGGTAPYSITVTPGSSLPPGLSLAAGSTVLSGVPTATGNFTFSLTATDHSNPVQTAQQTFTMPVGVNPLQVLPASGSSLPGGVVGQSYGTLEQNNGLAPTSVFAQGGIPPYHWAITQGVLPASSGLSINPTTGAVGATTFLDTVISGTPTTAGTYSFTLQCTDSSPTPIVSAQQTYTLIVINPVTYTPPTSGALGESAGIAASSNALWFTQQAQIAGAPGTGNLGIVGVESITTGGTFQYRTPFPAFSAPANPKPNAITADANGNLWIADASSPYVYEVTAAGASVTPISVQYFDSSTGTSNAVTPVQLAYAKDGGVWFTGNDDAGKGFIGRISTDGSNQVLSYPLPQYISFPTGIVPDPDGTHLWFLAQSNGPTVVVGRIDTSGNYVPPAGCVPPVTGFLGCFILDSSGKPVPPISADPTDSEYNGPLITLGSDKAIWFATENHEIGRITEDGSSVLFYPLPQNISSMALGSDGAIWASFQLQSGFGRISPSGQYTAFNVNALGITSGPDGALWLTDWDGGSITQIFPSLTLNCNVPGNLTVGVPIANASCNAVGGNGHYTYSYDTSGSPLGVTISSSGVISGTPTGTGFLIITVNDTSNPPQQASQVFSIQPASAITFSCNFPAGNAGQSYSASCQTFGGNPPYTYSATPSLPAGLIGTPGQPAAGETTPTYPYTVSGTLSPTLYGTVSFTIKVADSSKPANTATQAISITVTPLPVSASCSPNTLAVVNQAFQETCYGLLGTPPYKFSVAAPGLPAGLSINATTGVISGTPTAPGQTTIKVVVADANSITATLPVSLSVIQQKLALACNFPFNPTTKTAISALCVTSGGTPPYSYGSLPAGLSFDSTHSVISGTLATAGPASFTLQVTDADSATAQQKVNLFVHPAALTILNTNLPVPAPPVPYAVTLDVEGGTPPYTVKVSGGALPAGLQLAPGISGTGVIYNKAGGTSVAAGPYSFTITVTDAAKATVSQTFSGTVSTSQVGQSFISYALPNSSGANGITVGPDGNLWFTTIDQNGGNLLGRITTSGVITTRPAANSLTQSNGFEQPVGGDIATGPDGEIWTAQRDGNTVGEVAADQSSQLSYVPKTANSGPSQLVPAPDGALWFTETSASQIAHVDATGKLKEFPTKSASAGPYSLAVGPYNFLVYTETLPSANKIGVISEDGLTNLEFPIPTASSLPTSIVLGSDQAFWFTEFGANKIGRMDFAGNIVELGVSAAPSAITLGPDGALYFTETAANKIGRLTTAGVLTETAIPDANSGPTGIVAGPDGAIWFTENNLSKIGRLSFVLAPIVSCTLPAAPLQAGSAFSGNCTATQGTPPYQYSLSTAAGSTLPGASIDPNTGALSGTLTTAGTFTFNVMVTDSSSPAETGQQSYTFKVTPLPLSITCDTPTPRLYTPYAGASQADGCSAANGTPPYTYTQTGTLPPGLSFNTANGNITGTPTTLGTYQFTIQITDSSAPVFTVSQAVTLTVQYGAVTSTGKPLFTLTSVPLSVTPGTDASGIVLKANEPLLAALSGTAVLTFTVDPALLGTGNTPNNYVDPALQFLNSSGSPASATYSFTFPAGGTSLALPSLDPGTVVGTVDITINAAGLAQAGASIPVAGDTPVIEPGSVQFTNVSAAGFDIELIAMLPQRKAANATITFSPSSGDQISGQQTFVFNVADATNTWFASSNSLQYGGMCSLTFSFVFNGSIDAVGSATVTVDTSQPVSGNR